MGQTKAKGGTMQQLGDVTAAQSNPVLSPNAYRHEGRRHRAEITNGGGFWNGSFIVNGRRAWY